MGIGAAAHEHGLPPRHHRLRHNLRVVPASHAADCEDNGLPVRQPLGPPVAELAFLSVDLRHARRRSACRRHTREAGSRRRGEHDGVVRSPASSEPDRGIADGDGRTSVHRHFLELALREKCDPPMVWREKGRDGVVGSRQSTRVDAVQRSHEQLCATAARADVRDQRAIGRQRHGRKVEAGEALAGRQRQEKVTGRLDGRRVTSQRSRAEHPGDQPERKPRDRPSERPDASPHTCRGCAGGCRRFECFFQLHARVANIAQPLPRFFSEAPSQHTVDGGRDLGRQQTPVRLAFEHRGDDIGRGLAVERPVMGHQLEHHAAERPDIRSPIDRLAARLLRAHVRHSAEDHPGAESRRRRLRGAIARNIVDERLRQSEIQDLDGAFRCDLDVGGFQIPVDDAFLVRRFERLRDLTADSKGLDHRQATAQQAVAKSITGHELHHEKRRALGFVEFVHSGDVRMVHRREGERFATEADDALGIARELRTHDFQRDVAPEFRVAGLIHLAHASGAKRGDDFVRAESGAGCDAHGTADYSGPARIGGARRVPNRVFLTRNACCSDRAAVGVCGHLEPVGCRRAEHRRSRASVLAQRIRRQSVQPGELQGKTGCRPCMVREGVHRRLNG